MKKLWFLGLGISFILSLAACGLSPVEASESYVLVEINPKIEFTVDDDDIVTSVEFLNEDALTIGADIEFVGMDLDEALELFYTLALEAGYLDVNVDDNVIVITVGNDDEDLEEEIRQRTRGRAEDFMRKNRIRGGILSGEYAHEEAVEVSETYGITFAHAKAAIALVEKTEFTLEELVIMDFPELITLLKDIHLETVQGIGPAQKAAALERKAAMIEEYRERLRTHLENKEDISEADIEARIQEMRERAAERFNEYQEAYRDRQNRRENMRP